MQLWLPKRGNKSCGIRFMLRRSRLDERNIVSAVSPGYVDIRGRFAIMRYKNGREHIALFGKYVPPKPTGAAAKQNKLESL